MVILILFLGLAIPILIGFFLLKICFPHKRHRWLWITWKLFLAPAVGFALVSLTYYIWSVLFSPGAPIRYLIFIESSTIIGLIYLGFKNQSLPIENNFVLPRQSANKPLAIAATLLLLLLLANYFDHWLRASLSTPFGDWDAWAIWNLRASFIASGDRWLAGFSEVLSWSHPDYPLLLPLNIARIWVLLADRSVWVPILISLVYQVSLVGALVTTIQLERGYLQGIIAGIFGLLVLFASLSFKLYADVPIAVYILCANILIFFFETESKPNKLLALFSGFLVGAAVWTKNEGWAFLAATILVKLVVDFFNRKSRPLDGSWWRYFLLGLAPPLIATLHFKLALAPPSDLVENLDLSSMISDLLSGERYRIILGFAKQQFLGYGGLILPMIPLMLVYAVVTGVSIPGNQKVAVIALGLRITLLLVIYFFVYLLTPKDLAWHVSTSMERLVTQVFPSFILLFFLAVAPLYRVKITQT
ncbi:MAG: hypothetical protein ACK2UM_03450 [Anaerolineales bacterium]